MKTLNTFRKAWNILTVSFVVIAVIFALIFILPKAFNFRLYKIISGSMEPNCPVGSLIFVKEVPPESVCKNHIISYRLPDGTPCTHRVIDIDTENRIFYTQGDANDTPDPAVSFDRLIGKVVLCVPYLGYISAAVQSLTGKLVISTTVIILITVGLMLDFLAKKTDKN